MTLPPALRRLGKIWLMFAACGLFGALSTLAISADSVQNAGDKPAAEISSTADADQIRAAMAARRAAEPPTSPMDRAMSFFGIFGLIGICWLISSDRKKVDWRLVAWGVTLQFVFGLLILKTTPGLWFFDQLNTGTMALLQFTQEGVKFLFGSFITGKVEAPMVNFAFNVLPTIIFFSSLMAVGYHLGLMQAVVNVFAVVMHKTMKCSGAETLSASANIFVGQTEAPLVVKPYIAEMTNSEIMTIMVGGFATTAGGVMAAYVGMLAQYFPDIAGHLIAASVMSAPAALVCAKVAMPETGKPKTMGQVKMSDERIDSNVIDAAARGATEGLALAFNVGAMLLAFIALIAVLNAGLMLVGRWTGMPFLNMENILALAGTPIAFLMGVPLAECWTVGKLIGVKTAVNEFVAYLQLADILKNGGALSHRSVVICTYALCGFANFSSIGIQIGGISVMAPNRRHDLAKLGLKAMFVGCIAAFMTANIAGILVP